MAFTIPRPSLALAILALCACGNERPPLDAHGKVHLNAPLVGARLELQDTAGRRLMVIDRPTGALGTFSFALPARHAGRFRLVATGGTHGGQAFDDALVVDVEAFDPERELVYVNAATTMIARHRDRHPGLALDDAASAIKRFLAIPQSLDPGIGLDSRRVRYFGHEVLLARMAEAGVTRVGDYLRTLLDELDAGVPHHGFARESIGEKLTAKAFREFLGKSLKNELFAWGFNAAMTALGLSGMAEILEQLEEINARLDELIAEAEEILSEVKGLQKEIVASEVLDSIARIRGQYAFLSWATQHAQLACFRDGQGRLLPACAAESDALARTIRARMQAINDPRGVRGDLTKLRTALAGGSDCGPRSEQILCKWDAYLRTTKPFYLPTPDPRLVEIKEYYGLLESMAAHLLVEVAMAERDGQGKPLRSAAEAALSDLEGALAEQDALVSKRVSRPGTLDQNTLTEGEKQRVWLEAPISRLSRPGPGPGHPYGMWSRAEEECEKLRKAGFAGYHHWRLPTEEELHQVLHGFSDGSAGSRSGVFEWLISNGFQRAPQGGFDVRGFVTTNAAYFSSTSSGLFSVEALWDDGVDYACLYADRGNCSGFGHFVPSPGAWCVTERAE